MLKRNILLTSLLAESAVALAPALASACSVCLTGDNDPTANAFNWSVLFLMVTPYTVVGSIAGWLFFKYRRAAAKRDQEHATESPLHLALSEKESGR